jgi:TrmH family RNA methyltransferase
MKRRKNTQFYPHMENSVEPASITKRNDVRISRIRALQQRQFRDEERSFFCEGTRFLIRAFEQGTHIKYCVYASELFTGRYSHKLINRLERHGIPTLRVSKELFLSISMADEPSGLMAICGQQLRRLSKLNSSIGLWLALEAVRSPGNLGTIIRTCDAVGVAGIILLDPSIDPYHPATVRASMGSIFSVDLVRASFEEFRAWAKRNVFHIVGASPSGRIDYRSTSFKAVSIVLVMGSERKGLRPELQKQCNAIVRIPMENSVDSLNLAVATGVLLYEAFGQRS